MEKLRKGIVTADTNTDVLDMVCDFLKKTRYTEQEFIREAAKKRKLRLVPLDAHPRNDGAAQGLPSGARGVDWRP